MLTQLLNALDERGGKLTSAALAKPECIFNVDEYDVLRREDASDTIELNRDLLLKQFDLVE